MKHVSILIPERHSILSNIEGSLRITYEVTSFHVGVRKPPLFMIQLISRTKETLQRSQKNQEDEPIRKAQEFIEANFQDRVSVDQLTGLIETQKEHYC